MFVRRRRKLCDSTEQVRAVKAGAASPPHTQAILRTLRVARTFPWQTPFGNMFGPTPPSSKYDSIPREHGFPEPKTLFDEVITSQTSEGRDTFDRPSCSQNDLSATPNKPEPSLTIKRKQREEKIQERNLLFEKLLAGEEELEVFVVHEERF